MHIAFYHDAVIPPPKYGGTERVIYWLAKALNELGHKTTLFAREGSHILGTQIIPVWRSEDVESLMPADVDVFHYWNTPRQKPSKPYVITIGGNGQAGEVFDPNTIFVSRKHAANHGSAHYVHNGIDPDEYVCNEERTDHLVFLAKASWSVKNLRGAIDVARRAGLPLDVLGSRDWPWEMQRMFPRIRGVRYYGMVGDSEKRRILSSARALIFPVRWHEPFGLAVTEALASGCAVFGTPYGSLPEIVTPDVGFLSANVDELVNAVHRVRPTPQECRARVFQGFTSQDMAQRYLRYYSEVLKTGGLTSGVPLIPRTADGFVSKSLLPWGGESEHL